MRRIKLLEESGLLIKGVSPTIQNEAKEEKGEFLGMLIGTLGAILLGNLLTGTGVKVKILGRGGIKAGEGTIRAVERVIAASQGKGISRAGQGF